MKSINPQDIVELISKNTSYDDPPRLLIDRVAELIIQHFSVSDQGSAFELAESLLNKIKSIVLERQVAAERDGTTWICELYGSEGEFIRGSSFNDPTLTPDEQRIRANRAHIPVAKEALLGLSPYEFEFACTAILRLMGCSDPKTSPVRDDGGIDFYGRLELKGRLDVISPYGGIDRRAGVWLLGQAKHYPTSPVQAAHLRELVGSVELARTKGAIHAWEGLHLRPFDATLKLIFTTGTFSAGANLLLDKSGMISMNGRQLATFLCDAGVGIDPHANQFDWAKFRSDLGVTA